MLTITDEYDKEQGTDLPMFSRVGKTTVSMYIAFSQAALSKKEMEEYLKANPGADPDEYKKNQLKKRKEVASREAGMSDFAMQRQKFM